MITATQKKTAQSVVNIFETGSVLGNYGSVTLIEGDTGHLTYGRSQTTLGSGNLNELLQGYCDNPGARFGAALAPFLPRFQARDLSRLIADGVCGNATIDAVRNFQATRGLPATGIADIALIAELASGEGVV